MWHAVSRGQFLSEREKELEAKNNDEDLSQEELAELYRLQIRSTGQEIAVRDRHLEVLSRNVEEARAAAARKRDESRAWGALPRSDFFSLVILEQALRAPLLFRVANYCVPVHLAVALGIRLNCVTATAALCLACVVSAAANGELHSPPS